MISKFKKIISIILTLSLCLSFCTFLSVSAEETLLNSESFENGLGTWKYWNPASEACVSFVDGGSDGKKALKLVVYFSLNSNKALTHKSNSNVFWQMNRSRKHGMYTYTYI